MNLVELTRLAQLYAVMSERAQKALGLVAGVNDLLLDQPEVRAELRRYLDECEHCGVSLADVEQTRIILAALEGELEEAGEVEEGVVVLRRDDQPSPASEPVAEPRAS